MSETELRRLREHARRLERALNAAREKEISFHEVRERIFGLAQVPTCAPRWTTASLPSEDTPGTPVLMLSDWHAGECVRATEVNSVNSFNMPVLRRRVAQVAEGAVALTTRHATNPVYNGIVVPILGDMVTGEIHDELLRTNDTEILPAVLEVRDILTAIIRQFADTFGRVYVPCVAGNHGRIGRKLENKTFSVRNFDWLIYVMLQREFKDDPRVVVHVEESNEVMFAVHGLRFLALHGHDLGTKGGDGIIGALGPIMRGRLKVGQQFASVGRDFDILLLGHWHQYLLLPGVIVNNTLKGFDEFASKALRARPSRPSQALFYVHPRQGITSHWQVYADNPVRHRRGHPW